MALKNRSDLLVGENELLDKELNQIKNFHQQETNNLSLQLKDANEKLTSLEVEKISISEENETLNNELLELKNKHQEETNELSLKVKEVNDTNNAKTSNAATSATVT